MDRSTGRNATETDIKDSQKSWMEEKLNKSKKMKRKVSHQAVINNVECTNGQNSKPIQRIKKRRKRCKGINKESTIPESKKSKPSQDFQSEAEEAQQKIVNDTKVKNSNKNTTLKIEKLKQILADNEKHTPIKKTKQEPKSLRERMMEHLRASRFRFLNESLYVNESAESKKYFKENPDAFTAYHDGYKQQTEQWPLNPLDVIISSIKKLPKDYVIADFGCGEARLAASVDQKVHSFDLVAMNERVTACDVTHTPLLANSVHVVVLCLSLMAKNLNDYVAEANRVLKKDGILKIAEVESRFDNVQDFITVLQQYGFTNTWMDLSHNLFYFLDFKKISDLSGKRSKLPVITLKPCLYKKR